MTYQPTAEVEAEARRLCFEVCSTGGFLDYEAGCCSTCKSPQQCQSWRVFDRDARLAVEARSSSPTA